MLRLALAATVAALAILSALPSSASAVHLTCSMFVYTPWAVKQDGNVVQSRGAGEADCAYAASGRMHVALWRDRWWGMEQVASSSHSLDNYGNSGFITATWWCNGVGTYTYRTIGTLSVYHAGAGPNGSNTVFKERQSDTSRFDC